MKSYNYLPPASLLALAVAALLSSACMGDKTQLGVKMPEEENTAPDVPTESKAQAVLPPSSPMFCEKAKKLEQTATYRANDDAKLREDLGGAFIHYKITRDHYMYPLVAEAFVLPVISKHRKELCKLIKKFRLITEESEQIDSVIEMDKFVGEWPFLETDFHEFLEDLSLPPSTLCNLGVRYFDAKNVVKSNKRVVILFRKAANQGDASAQYNLGWMYANGRGVEQNDQKAVEWYRKAADQEHASAQFNLGEMYQYGRGVEQNDQKAAEWYTKAAEQGDADAQTNLGVMYQLGRGVDQNDQKAAEWYRKAAEQGHKLAKIALRNLDDLEEDPHHSKRRKI